MNSQPIEFAFLANVPLLAGLTPEDFSQLIEFTEMRHFESGETLFLKGDPGGELIVVIDGEVELFIYDDNNRRLVLSQVSSGGFFGEITLFDGSPRTTNALATKSTRVMLLRSEVMITFLRKYPDAAIHVINVLSRRLRDTTELATGAGGNAFDMLQESSNVWERLADRLSALVGSWPYLAALITLILIWVVVSVLSDPQRNIPGPIDGMGIVITMVGALQLPLILMSQNRQDKFEKIQANLDHDVNVKAQLSILGVTRKLDWLQESMLHQAQRLDKLEADHSEAEDHRIPPEHVDNKISNDSAHTPSLSPAASGESDPPFGKSLSPRRGI